MSKFRKKTKEGAGAISTASLPDIVFMILFFFMVSTTMKEVELKIKMKLPEASEVKKLENKSLVSYIYVGTPNKMYQGKFGTEPMIQLNDQLSNLTDIYDYIIAEREEKGEALANQLITAIKVDSDTEMGIVTDLKQELRKVNALKINYSTRKVDKKK